MKLNAFLCKIKSNNKNYKKMKAFKFLKVGVICITCMSSIGQPTFTEELVDVNNIRTYLNTNGSNFWDGSRPQFQVPKISNADILAGKLGPSTIFSNSIFIGAKIFNKANTSYEMYSNDTFQFTSGTIANYLSSPSTIQNYNKIWSVLRSDIIAFKMDFEDNGIINNPVPISIIEWPAKGSITAKGFNNSSVSFSQTAAPFVDRNGDGIYNYLQGDYPLIKGDKYFWWIVNDYTTSTHMLIDIHHSAWAYDCSDSTLNNSIFLSHKVYNRSSLTMDSFYIGEFTDFDLGNFADDMIGFNSKTNSYFAYNGDDFDELLNDGARGYGSTLPIQFVKFLNRPMNQYRYFINGDTSEFGVPKTDAEAFQNLKGNSKYGKTSPLGIDGNPSDTSMNSMCNKGIQKSDYRGLGSSGPYTLLKDSFIELTTVFSTFLNTKQKGCHVDIKPYLYQLDSIQKYYEDEKYPCWWTAAKSLTPKYGAGVEEMSIKMNIYPNPTTSTFKIDFDSKISSLEIFNMIGEKMMTQSDILHPIIDCSTFANGTYEVLIKDSEGKMYRERLVVQK
jgi:hypothetical protein